MANHARAVFDSVFYSLLGTLVLFVAFWAIEKALPFSIHKEIAEDQNVALGIVVGSIFIGLALVLGAAIQG